MKWNNPKTNPPPAGKRVIARCAGFTGEAYLSIVGGKSQWMRSYNVPWESWAQRPVEEWTEMPE